MQVDTIEMPRGKIFYVGQTPVGIIECRKKRLVIAAADPGETEEELRHKLSATIEHLTRMRRSGMITPEN